MPNETRTNARLSIPLDENGMVDMEHMRPSTAQKLVDLLKTDPKMRAAYQEVNNASGGANEDVPAILEGITEENVSQGLDLIAKANALLFRVCAARFIKHPFVKDANNKPLSLVVEPDILNTAFRLTPEQHKELDPRAMRLAQKYTSELPDWLKKNLDLYMLCSAFIFYTAQNAQSALELQVKRDLDRARNAIINAQVNQPKNPKSDSDVRAQPVNGHDRTPPPPPPPPARRIDIDDDGGRYPDDQGRPLV